MFTRTLKQAYKGFSKIERLKRNNKTTNHRFYDRIYLGRKSHLIPAHDIEKYFKQ